MAAGGIPELLKKWRYRKEALVVLSVSILSCFSIVTWTQVGYWRNSIALFDYALEVTSHNDLIRCNQGVVYDRMGNHSQAIEDFTRAVEVDPKYADAYYNRGVAYAKLGNPRQAIENMKTAAQFGIEGAKNFLKSQGMNW
jgi:tetratricopeptide (TPR) repeat protein